MSQEKDVEARVSPNAIPEVQATKAPSVEGVSIYSYKETWFIVGTIALAGFARYAYFGFFTSTTLVVLFKQSISSHDIFPCDSSVNTNLP